MSEEIQATAVAVTHDPETTTTRKTAACAVSLGVAILGQLIGKDISNVPTENANQLMATVINNELKLN